MKLVLDTNVLISVLFFSGQTTRVLSALRAEMQPVVSPEILAEFRSVVNRKFSARAAVAEQALGTLLRWVEVETLRGEAVEVCRDPADNHVLQLCRSVRASILLTGDADLLVLKHFEGTRILSPSELAHELGLT